MKAKITMLLLSITILIIGCTTVEYDTYTPESNVEEDDSIQIADITGVWYFGDSFLCLYGNSTYSLFLETWYFTLSPDDIISSGTYTLNSNTITLNSYWYTQDVLEIGLTIDNKLTIKGDITENDTFILAKSNEELPESKVGSNGYKYKTIGSSIYKLYINIISNYALTYTLYKKDSTNEYTILKSSSTEYYVYRDGYLYLQSPSGGDVSKEELVFYSGLSN